MKTHMNNTQAMKLTNDVVGHQHFLNHQKALHTDVKPVIVTKRKQEVKIQKNKKVELNSNPKSHVNNLYSNLYNKTYKSTIDNKNDAYAQQKELLANKIKRNKYEKTAMKEHEQELRSMNDRIVNCKNLQQRKKDKTDPISNPAYFIKSTGDVSSININEYSKKVLGLNRPQSGTLKRQESVKRKVNMNAGIQSPEFQPVPQTFGSMSHYAKERPKSANPNASKAFKSGKDDLPGCTFKEILNHIVDHKLFKDVEMKVLYVRLCHQYGEEEVADIWDDLMSELQK